jgi:hypothetical protein
MTPRTLALAPLAAALVLGGGGAADACQPEHCPPPPLLCEWGPFAGTCIYPY